MTTARTTQKRSSCSHASAHQGCPPRRFARAPAADPGQPGDLAVPARQDHHDRGQGQAAAAVRRAPDHQGQARRPAQPPRDPEGDPGPGDRAPADARDRPVLRRPQRRLHAHHQDAAAPGRQRPDGRDRAGVAEDRHGRGGPRPARGRVAAPAGRHRGGSGRGGAGPDRRGERRRRGRGRPATAAETADAPAADAPAAEAPAEESTSTADAPYGEGSHAPLADPSEAPEGFPIKGNEDSKIYHVPESPHYGRTVAEVWFATPEAAEAAGFEPPAAARPEPPQHAERARRPPNACPRSRRRQAGASRWGRGRRARRRSGSVSRSSAARSRVRPPGSGSTSPTTAPTSPAGPPSPAGARSPGC